jgi:23S rRNA (guanosine2251-2'-O)-methyltransferase
MHRRVAVLLHNVRSTHNVGSIFRTAEAAGVEKIYLSGYTPIPKDRFGREQKDIAKTALGAEKILPWEHCASPMAIIKKLSARSGPAPGGKKNGWKIIGVEQDKRAVDYKKLKLSKHTLFIFGNEVRGISPATRSKCDTIIEIPMYGKKESLNVSVAAGIILFAVSSQ